jgi:NADH-quinone oxidoreductase subunit E
MNGESKLEIQDVNGVVDEIVSHYEDYKNNLISILQKTQDKLGYLPKEAIGRIAEQTGIQEAKIFGVATFYTQFKLKPAGKHTIMICKGTACHVKGAGAVEKAVMNHLSIQEGDTTADGLFTYNSVACLGCCSLAPVMMIGETVFAKLTPKSAVEAVESIRAKETQS